MTGGAGAVNSKAHWERVYREKRVDEMSWYQAEARFSLGLIQEVVPELSATMIDVGAGASTLVDGLVAAGYRHLTVLDVSGEAIRHAQDRMDDRQALVEWIEGDVLTVPLPAAAYDLWHDRAAFHFLTSEADRRRYVEQARHAVRPGGYVLVATFAEDGPTKCSGLDVVRYSPEKLQSEFGGEFVLVKSAKEEHRTPRGVTQSFAYCLCRHESHEAAPLGS